jgi:hypothetical protein
VSALRVLATNVSGYAWPLDAWERALEWRPDVISAQGTTLDDGAYLLGSSEMYTRGGRLAFRRAADLVFSAADGAAIPAVISVGDSGHDVGLEGALRVIDDVAGARGIRPRLAVISGEVDKEYLLEKLRRGVRMPRLVDHPKLSPYLTEEDVAACTHVVAQMGPEPIVDALERGVDGVVTGRALDEAVHMALPLSRGMDRGTACHMAKIAETAQSGGTWRAPHLIELDADRFRIKPADSRTRCTTTSVASVALYERPSPRSIAYPGGTLDLSNARYTQVDDVTVEAAGAAWTSAPYTVKLEGARWAGRRFIGIAGARDPAFVSSIESILATVERELDSVAADFGATTAFRHKLRVFGRNAVLEGAEPVARTLGHELGIVVDVVSADAEVSRAACYRALHTLLMCDFPGRKSTSGNVAWCTSPEVIDAGDAYEFQIHHLLPLDDPAEPFRTSVVAFPRESAA